MKRSPTFNKNYLRICLQQLLWFIFLFPQYSCGTIALGGSCLKVKLEKTEGLKFSLFTYQHSCTFFKGPTDFIASQILALKLEKKYFR